VRAIGKDITDGGDGFPTRQAVETISDQMAVKYGQPTRKANFTNAQFSQPQFWVMEVKESSRVYANLWTFKTPQVGNVEGITVVAKAASLSTTYVMVEFEFANNSQCDQISKNHAADVF